MTPAKKRRKGLSSPQGKRNLPKGGPPYSYSIIGDENEKDKKSYLLIIVGRKKDQAQHRGIRGRKQPVSRKRNRGLCHLGQKTDVCEREDLICPMQDLVRDWLRGSGKISGRKGDKRGGGPAPPNRGGTEVCRGKAPPEDP